MNKMKGRQTEEKKERNKENRRKNRRKTKRQNERQLDKKKYRKQNIATVSPWTGQDTLITFYGLHPK